MRKLAFLVVLLISLTGAAYAQEATYAIAMHDAPKYPADFTHFDYTNPDAPKGGTLRRAEIGTFDNLNPFLITGRVTIGLQEALMLTYDSLMVRAWNEPFTMYGLVAKNVIVPPERNWIEFILNPDAHFHDGTKITSEDVKFTFETLKKSGRPNQRRIYKLVKDVTIKDDHTIRFTLGAGYDRETVMILSGMPVLPKHYWEKNDFSKTTLVPPESSGPYKIASVDVGRRVVFERVKDYWAKNKATTRGLYNFDKLQYDFFRDDHIALQALAAGQIDLRKEYSPVIWKRDYSFKAIDDGSVIKENFKNGRPAKASFFVFNMRRTPFDDINIRKALVDAFDFEWLNRSLFLETQTRISSLFTNSELADQSADKFIPPSTDTKEGLRGNLRKAIELLKQSGWELHEGAMTKNGQTLHFEILLNDPNDEKVALAYSRNLKRIGIDMTIRTVDTAQYIGRLSQFDFDVTSNFWRNTLSPGTEQAVYWGSAAAANQGSFNYSGLKSPKVDGLITELTTSKNRGDLVKAARALDHEVMAQYIGIPLYDAPEDRIAYRKGLKHPEMTPLYGPVVESWWYAP
jgi:ABC-type oligopeptide transport system substrate-binding subunit